MEGLGVYKYLQIFLVLVDVMELEHVRVFNELQDGDLPLHLRGQGHEKGSASPPYLSTKGHSCYKHIFMHMHTHTYARTFISTDSDNFSLFTILTATF